jgi:hypothetical protein
MIRESGKYPSLPKMKLRLKSCDSIRRKIDAGGLRESKNLIGYCFPVKKINIFTLLLIQLP